MRYFDAHCHLQFEGYDEDRAALVERMRDEGVGGLVVGVDYESSKKAVAFAQQYEHLYASIGLHPNDTGIERFEREDFDTLAEDGKVVAIGECGLDYFRPENPDAAKQKQRQVFEEHIDLAVRTGKPLMIHARPSKGSMDAYEDALTMLESAKREHPELRGDFHFFVGDQATAARIVALDFTISYTAVLTFARDYDEVVRSVPPTHLLSETDAPFVAPKRRRGERNDPLAAVDVVEAIADIRAEDPETVRTALLDNAKRLFRL
jgi:TatD DNase family protein